MCDSGRCLLPVSVCDSQLNCQDQTDEANCSRKDNGKSFEFTHKLLPGSLTMYYVAGKWIVGLSDEINNSVS